MIHDALVVRLAGKSEMPEDFFSSLVMRIKAFRNAGYDYVPLPASDMCFPCHVRRQVNSRNMNEGASITDRSSYHAYPWPSPDDCAENTFIPDIAAYLPDGMKIIAHGPCGVLENVTALLGYDAMCYLTADDPELLRDVFYQVGSRLARYYELAVQHDSIGAFISNDDWGFTTQTMLSSSDMRMYVIPWHKNIADVIRGGGKPAILHSCGNIEALHDDIMMYDGKHSFEDKIMPVEQAYEALHPRIAVLGGIDIDFISRKQPEEIYNRSCEMLQRASSRGGYALGTGNSVPHFVPDENYLAMISAAVVN
jgi:uroporphyrinogen decarboxylase